MRQAWSRSGLAKKSTTFFLLFVLKSLSNFCCLNAPMAFLNNWTFCFADLSSLIPFRFLMRAGKTALTAKKKRLILLDSIKRIHLLWLSLPNWHRYRIGETHPFSGVKWTSFSYSCNLKRNCEFYQARKATHWTRLKALLLVCQGWWLILSSLTSGAVSWLAFVFCRILCVECIFL